MSTPPPSPRPAEHPPVPDRVPAVCSALAISVLLCLASANPVRGQDAAAPEPREVGEPQAAAATGDTDLGRRDEDDLLRRGRALDRHGLDLLSLERLRWGCRNEAGRKEVTLFGDGTVRLRDGIWEDQAPRLDRLPPTDFRDYLERLLRIRLSPEFPEAWDLPGGVDGRFTEACELYLGLPGVPPVRLHFGNYDTLPLELGQIEQIVEELALGMKPNEGPRRLPEGYEPQPFDVLESADGKLYSVIGLTDDGVGFEVESLSEPVRTFYRLEDLRLLFVALLPPGQVPIEEAGGVELVISDPPQ